MKENRFCVGIDLGTTNCALSYFDLTKPSQPIQQFKIAQLSGQGFEESLPLLPSFLYIDEKEEIIVGAWAKVRGAQTPTRLVQSAKSWLTHGAAHRKEKILPFAAPQELRAFSPVEATAHVLIHLKNAWNQQIAKADPALALEEQHIVLTIPASFDEVARRLTLEAASKAGLNRITLLEEPQAAFYNWIMEKGRTHFTPGELILICDVGGGTCDFSLIEAHEGPSEVELQRMAVGRHLLLGGDNMDLALAHYLEKKLPKTIDGSQYLSLLQQARTAKETLLANQKRYSIHITGKGSHVIEGSLATDISYEEMESVLIEGFFGLYDFNEAINLNRGSGIRQMGLPFETETSITKHLAFFLYKNGCKKKPEHILFNGGAFHPQAFQNRIVDSLNRWFPENYAVHVLATSSLDIAVSRGAAYLAKLQEMGGSSITGGIPRSYYLGLNGISALTIVPRGSHEGEKIRSSHQFSLIPNQPVSFQLYHSNTRIEDKEGDLVQLNEEDFTPLPTLQTQCTYGKKESKEALPVLLEIELTNLGTLELWLHSQVSHHRWKLEFQLRGEHDEDRSQIGRASGETFDTHIIEGAKQTLEEAFAIGSHAHLNNLMSQLEQQLEMKRNLWSPTLLRGLYDSLLQQAYKRLLSVEYESRFWNLAGFLLRPGFGYPLDDSKIKQLWKVILADLKKVKSEEVLVQQWVCYRRVAAGLSKGAQIQLFNDILTTTQKTKAKKKGYVYAEQLRALASFELVDCAAKIKLGETLIKKIQAGNGEACDFWAIGRLGARQLFHGTAANVIAPSTCEQWIEALLSSPYAQHEHLTFTLSLLARKTDNRTLDLSPSLLEKIAPLLPPQEGLLTVKEQERIFGDSLPSGLILRHL